jgi:hypothetical protein
MIDTSEIITSKNHIEPLAEDGYIIYKLGYISPVKDGKRDARMIWGNVKTGGSVGSLLETQELTSATNLSVNFLMGANLILTMAGNITNLTFSNITDGGQGDILVLQNSTGGFGITNIIHAGLTSCYPDPDGDNTPNKPVAANINSVATGKTVISYHRVGSYLLITYGNYA